MENEKSIEHNDIDVKDETLQEMLATLGPQEEEENQECATDPLDISGVGEGEIKNEPRSESESQQGK